MDFHFYSSDELKFYISVLDSLLDDFTDKVNMLENLKDEFETIVKNRGDN